MFGESFGEGDGSQSGDGGVVFGEDEEPSWLCGLEGWEGLAPFLGELFASWFALGLPFGCDFDDGVGVEGEDALGADGGVGGSGAGGHEVAVEEFGEFAEVAVVAGDDEVAESSLAPGARDDDEESEAWESVLALSEGLLAGEEAGVEALGVGLPSEGLSEGEDGGERVGESLAADGDEGESGGGEAVALRVGVGEADGGGSEGEELFGADVVPGSDLGEGFGGLGGDAVLGVGDEVVAESEGEEGFGEGGREGDDALGCGLGGLRMGCAAPDERGGQQEQQPGCRCRGGVESGAVPAGRSREGEGVVRV